MARFKMRQLPYIFVILCVASLVVYSGLFKINFDRDDRECKKNIFEEEQWCKFTQLDIDSPSVGRFFREKPRSIECTSEKNWVKFDADDRLVIETEAITKHGEIDCRLRHFWRVDNKRNEFGLETKLKPGQKLESDFAEVNCTARDNATYSNRLATVIPLKNASDRANSKQIDSSKTALGLNVFMLGFDSMSRLAMRTNLPKMYEYLTEKMDAIVLEGYNIVGDGTPQALIPILTGKTELGLPSTRKEDKGSAFVDVYPWIWKEFENAGYVTLFFEDSIRLGIFEYRLNEFKDQPTDHFMRTYYFDNPKDSFCEGSEEQYKTFIGFGQRFWREYQNQRKFAYQFNSIYSHDDINLIPIMDAYMVDHLKFIHQHIDDTIVIVMADHEARFGKSRETEQGKLEERLPFFSFALPPWFKRKYPRSYQSFKDNAKRLTTPFDIHATLREILDFRAESNQGPPIEKNRQLSLFRPVPANRTCSDAGVEPHWCTCLRWINVSADEDTIVQSMVREFESFVNRQTEDARDLCSELNLDHMISARKYSSNPPVLKYRKNSDRHGFDADLSDNATGETEFYQLDVRMQPGNGRYQLHNLILKLLVPALSYRTGLVQARGAVGLWALMTLGGGGAQSGCSECTNTPDPNTGLCCRIVPCAGREDETVCCPCPSSSPNTTSGESSTPQTPTPSPPPQPTPSPPPQPTPSPSLPFNSTTAIGFVLFGLANMAAIYWLAKRSEGVGPGFDDGPGGYIPDPWTDSVRREITATTAAAHPSATTTKVATKTTTTAANSSISLDDAVAIARSAILPYRKASSIMAAGNSTIYGASGPQSKRMDGEDGGYGRRPYGDRDQSDRDQYRRGLGRFGDKQTKAGPGSGQMEFRGGFGRGKPAPQ